ncbi:Hypp9340 [Branchiostoma lanceolatum]|uniref:Hypp9340 protein n=1 Tax=Branchiostoma lanceolatum TaxID=7740 RepID=A0A8S4MLA2_BRALA|nr:Hypp9340 [Branchiostoma lanceolatum]
MADGGSITGKRKRVSRGGRRQDTAKKRKEKERVRNTSRVFLDHVFDDWKDLRKELELERDRDLARLLIDRISVLFSDDEEEDWTDDECEDLDWIDDKSADPDYEPTARIKAALKVPSNFNIEDLEVTTAEEEVYDHLGDDVETDEEEVEEDNGGKEINSTSPKHSAPQVEVKVEREEDLIGEKCCLAYKQCLLELVKFLDSGRFCSEPGCKGKVEPQTRMVGTAMVIESAGQEKGCSGLKEWTSDIVNHFWWCCGKANDYKEFMELWEGMLHHVCDEHEWALGRCRHHDDEDDNEDDSLSATEETQKKPKTPLVPNSVAVRKLTSIALDKTWLKKVHKYLNFRTTSELESFQNHILMYASKRHAFCPPVYEARCQLAAIDYNKHLGRPDWLSKEGEAK